MIVSAIRTHKITNQDKDIFPILDKYLPDLSENSVVVVTSKIVAICEGRLVKMGEGVSKIDLVKEEADYYLPPESNKYNSMVTVKGNVLLAAAGIDESNGNGHFVLLPKDPQSSANKIREHLTSKYRLKNIGVVITDSRTTPLRWGTTGVAIAHSGFAALNDYIGKPDLFGYELRITKANLADALAVAAVAVMGEGQEQTPLGVIEDVPFVEFQNRNPSAEELSGLCSEMEDDLYAALLTSAPWQKK